MEQTLWEKIYNNPIFNNIYIGALLLFINIIFYMNTLINDRITRERDDLYFLLFLRMFIAIPGTTLLAYIWEGKFQGLYTQLNLLLVFGFFGVFSVALNQIMYQVTVQYTTSFFACLLAQIIPVTTFVVSKYLKWESLSSFEGDASKKRLVGFYMGVSLGCAAFAISFYQYHPVSNFKYWIIGIVVGLINNSVFVCYVWVQVLWFYNNPESPLQNKPLTLNCLFTIYGSVFYVVIFMVYFLFKNGHISNNIQLVFPIVYSGIVDVVIGSGLFVYCIKHFSAPISTFVFSTQLGVTLVVGRIVIGSQISYLEYVLCALLLISAELFVFSSKFSLPTPKPEATSGQATEEENAEPGNA